MTQQDFQSGRWEPYIVEAAALKNTWSIPASRNAGEVILQFLKIVVHID